MKKATVIFRDIMARYAPNHGIAICVKEKPEEEIPDFTNRVTDGWTIPTSAPFRRRCWMPVLCSKDRWSIPAREWGVIAFVRSEPTVLVPTAWGAVFRGTTAPLAYCVFAYGHQGAVPRICQRAPWPLPLP